MDQWHEHLLLHPQKLPHRILYLGVLSPIAHLPDALVDRLGQMALFLWKGFVFFDDLSDPLKTRANLRLGSGLLQTIPRVSGWANIFFNVPQPILHSAGPPVPSSFLSIPPVVPSSTIPYWE